MTLVNNDDREGVLRVVLGEKASVTLIFVVQAQGLIGGDVYLGILGCVLPAFGFDDAHTAFGKGFAELLPGLLAQFVAVAQKQGWFGQLAGLVQAPQQVGGNHCLARARGQREQHACGFAILAAPQHLFERGTDGGILVVAWFVKGS